MSNALNLVHEQWISLGENDMQKCLLYSCTCISIDGTYRAAAHNRLYTGQRVSGECQHVCKTSIFVKHALGGSGVCVIGRLELSKQASNGVRTAQQCWSILLNQAIHQ